MNLRQLKRRAAKYVEDGGRTTVRSVRFARRFSTFGREDVALLVVTDDMDQPEWWVIGGSTPMNLYAKSAFPEVDVAYSLHLGLYVRMTSRDYDESGHAPEEIGYDAFISHASEDKADFVRPLAAELTARGAMVWFDEFALRVGDSLRRSIDQGLLSSRFGIVVLSKAFFDKNWPAYELDGIVAREIEGMQVVLPIWHGITKADVLAVSPSLADKVALDTSRMDLGGIADALIEVFNRATFEQVRQGSSKSRPQRATRAPRRDGGSQ